MGEETASVLFFYCWDFVVIFEFSIYIHSIQNMNMRYKYILKTEKHTLL